MACKTCKKKKCGCADKGLTSPPPCDTTSLECANPEPCAETFSTKCLIYTGNNIPALGINMGDRTEIIIQRLAMLLLNPGCILPGSTCLAVLGVEASSIGVYSMTIKWLESVTASSYTVQYKKSTDALWTVGTSVPAGTLTYNITGLSAATLYDIKVTAVCSTNCDSLTIQVATKPAP